MKGVVTAILGGGQGTRLWPLTLHRAKPAVPIGGKFRLIDIPVSNSLHAGIEQIYVLTQFNSASLHRHIAQAYRFDVFRDGFVNILAAEQGLDNRDWYQGTADAVRQNLQRLLAGGAEDVLILSGDQLYLMDLVGFVEGHRERRADFSVAVKPVPRGEAPGLGIMRIDERGRIVEFAEKPSDPQVIDGLALDAETIERLDLDAEPGTLLASMGIYVFRASVLGAGGMFDDDCGFGSEAVEDLDEGSYVVRTVKEAAKVVPFYTADATDGEEIAFRRMEAVPEGDTTLEGAVLRVHFDDDHADVWTDEGDELARKQRFVVCAVAIARPDCLPE